MGRIDKDKFKFVSDQEKVHEEFRPSLTYWQDAWRRLKKNKMSMVGLVGGEPLLHPKIDEMITIASKRKMTVNLSTNGYFLTEERIRSLLKSPLETSRLFITL